MPAGESSVSLSLGGPIAMQVYGPLPLLSVGYNQGLIDRKLDLEIGTHLTQALFGIAMLDAGVNWHPFTGTGAIPGIMVSPKVFAMSDFSKDGARFYPSAGATAIWQIRGGHVLYGGIDNWFELRRIRADGFEQEQVWLLAPFLGASLARNHWRYRMEARIFAPNLDNRGRGAKYIGIGNYGALGMFVGVSRSFGGE
jgi:hypothetical protein